MKRPSEARGHPWRLGVSAAIIALAGASACSSGTGTGGGGGTVAGKPTCTSAAIQNAVRKTIEKSGGTLKDVQFFKCSGGFAFALADEQDGQNINAIPILFKASSVTWAAVDRGTYCTNGSIPKDIYASVCEAS